MPTHLPASEAVSIPLDQPVTNRVSRVQQCFVLATAAFVALYAGVSLRQREVDAAEASPQVALQVVSGSGEQETADAPSAWPNITPERKQYLLGLLQGLCLAGGVWYFSWTATRRILVAAVATTFCCVAQPWNWNLANDALVFHSNFTPHSGWLACGLLLPALACVLRDRDWQAACLLTVAGLTDLPVALYGAVVVACAWLLQDWCGYSSRLFSRGLLLAAGCGVLVLVSLIAGQQQPNSTTSSPAVTAATEAAGTAGTAGAAADMAALKLDAHLWPWGQGLWLPSLAVLAVWTLMSVNAARRFGLAGNPVARLWMAAVAGVTLCGVAHVAGAITEQPWLLQLCGLRAASLMVLTSVPMVLTAWIDRIAAERDWFGTTAAVLCLLVPFVAPAYPLLWSPFFVLLWTETAGGGVLGTLLPWTWARWMHRFRHRVSAVLLLCWTFLFLTWSGIPLQGLQSGTGGWAFDGHGVSGGLAAQLPSTGTRLLLLALAGFVAAHRYWWPRTVAWWQMAVHGEYAPHSQSAESGEPSDRLPGVPHASILPALSLLLLAALAGSAWTEAAAVEQSPVSTRSAGSAVPPAPAAETSGGSRRVEQTAAVPRFRQAGTAPAAMEPEPAFRRAASSAPREAFAPAAGPADDEWARYR